MPDWLIAIDTRLFLQLNVGSANEFFDWLMPIVTSITYIRYAVAAALIPLVVFGGGKGRSAVLIAIVLVAITDQTASYLLKPLVGRPRPCHDVEGARILTRCGRTLSFPSGHATSTMAAALFFGLLYRRWLWTLIGVSVLVSYSRVYVGVHYPFDLLGGWVYGGLCGLGMISLYRRHLRVLLARWRVFADSPSAPGRVGDR